MERQHHLLVPGGSARRPTRALAILLSGAMVLGAAPAQTPGPRPAPPELPRSVAASTVPEGVLTLREAVQLAVLNNPEVLAKWHTVRAAEGEKDAARGGLFPRVDLTASAGPERRSEIPGNYTRTFGTLSLTQLLWDGAATMNEVKRLDATTRVRVFELIAASENVALEAARAYYDVVRYRELVKLAEENFVEHRTVFQQTDQRVKARVARAVDLEQITGRLALAEANLVIETANLHDTTARFQRIVGRMPSREMPLPASLAQGVPADARTALEQTTAANPNVLAAVESVRAADAALETRNGAYQPRLDFRVRRDQGRNLDGIRGNSNVNVAEVLLNWNLFNGFADRARERQFAEQLNVARDVRDKTCRDMRQTTMIAYNDILKLKEQLVYLQQHEESLSKALTAYRLQFQIGQRTLLDLLDTENERFQSRRSVVNARQDLETAYMRTQAGIGNLQRALALNNLETGREAELQNYAAGADAAQQCPAEPVTVYTVDKEALVQRASQIAARSTLPLPRAAASAEMAPATADAAAPVAPPAVASVAPLQRPLAAGPEQQAVRAALETWRSAWASRDVSAYLRAYAPTFNPSKGQPREAWENGRRAVITKSTDISVEFSDVNVTTAGRDRATVTFLQKYRSASYQDQVRKTMEWRLVDGRWMIVSETSTPV